AHRARQVARDRGRYHRAVESSQPSVPQPPQLRPREGSASRTRGLQATPLKIPLPQGLKISRPPLPSNLTQERPNASDNFPPVFPRPPPARPAGGQRIATIHARRR